MEVRRDILWRVYLSFIGITVLSLLVLGRAFYIQRFEGSYWRKMSDSLHQKIVTVDAGRGTIYSEDGQMLSTSLPQFNIYIDFMADGLREKNGRVFRENIDSFSRALSVFFGDKSAAAYKRELQTAYQDKNRYYPLHMKLSFEQYKEFRDFPLVRLGKNKSGVITEVQSFRKNPFEMMARRTIGLYRKNAPNIGLERQYDSLLQGKEGKRLVRYIAGGVPVPIEGSEIDPQNGKDIITTIDVNIQDIAETALNRMMLKSEAAYGTCIVMETKTGKVKAIANLGRHADGTYDESFNYALLTTEPGSTMKLATLLSVLSEGSVKIDDMVEVGSTGQMVVGPRPVTDAERSPSPVLTVKDCFAHSSNIGMSKVGYKTFAGRGEKFAEYLHKFRLDSASGIDLPGENKPNHVALGKKGNPKDMVTMFFGYAIEVSPLQTLTLYNAIANNGTMVKPYLVNSVQQNGVTLKEYKPVVLRENLCSPEVINAARSSMEAVVQYGTARAAFKGMTFPVAGKTGTAHVSDGKITYDDGIYQASFVGYFPADKPQYSCIVLVRSKPFAAEHFGGSLAAPVFREIATKLYALYVDKKDPSQLQVSRDSSAFLYAGNSNDIRKVYGELKVPFTDSISQSVWGRVYSKQYSPVAVANPVRQQQMPDVRGMGLKDALYLLENLGMRVNVSGKGKVQNQSVAAGTVLQKGTQVTIELD